MSDSLHDTIDIKDDIEAVDEPVEVDEVAQIMATATPAPVRPAERRAGIVELILVSAANAIWAVIGLVIWLPQAVRAVLAATLRMIHAALTHQASGRAVAGIKRVSRSYVDRFLVRQGDPSSSVGRRAELRPFSLLGETAWTVAFYLLVLRWLAPRRFEPIWQRLGEAASRAGAAAAGAAGTLKSWVVLDLASIDANRAQAGGMLLLVAFVGVLLGYWLGRRRS